VTRLGITYGVLRRLGFSQDKVDECLRAIQGVDLEEAYEWVRPSSTLKPALTFCSFTPIALKMNSKRKVK
jgi:hypothetical protein